MISIKQTEQTVREQRRTALTENATLMGIDYIEVVHQSGLHLSVYFIEKITNSTTSSGAQIIPDNVKSENIQIVKSDGTHASLHVVSVDPMDSGNPNRLIVNLSRGSIDNAKDFTPYLFRLINVANIGPYFDSINFSLQANAPTEFDCTIDTVIKKVIADSPEIDYLAKDYQSFRRLMLDRLSVLTPNWQQANAADLEMVLVEILAYVADYLSYYQDAVATEAYLGTARKRVSVKRHARLLDYIMHEGCNARTWVQVQVNAEMTLEKSTRLFTKVKDKFSKSFLAPSIEYDEALASDAEVFETLYEVKLYPEHNKIDFYTWDASEFSVKQGSTAATLVASSASSNLQLHVGDILIFVQNPSVVGLDQDADPGLRHVVRLSKVIHTTDPLHNKNIIEVTWHSQDALPFDFPITLNVSDKQINNIGIALGNIVLADHGRSFNQQDLNPAVVPQDSAYRPYLHHKNVTFRVPFDAAAAAKQPANLALKQAPHLAQPDIKLMGDQQSWQARLDLLNSDRLTQHFVVEIDNDRKVFLRFGNDVFGKRPNPDTKFLVDYRIGNGSIGNVGADSIKHIVTDTSNINKIIMVTNPLPAHGGREPESIDHVKRYASQVFRRQKRAVTEQDYIDIATRHPEVDYAAASLQWTGSWNTTFISVKRSEARPLDAHFKQQLFTYMQQFQLLGHDVEIIAPHLVALDIVLPIGVQEGYLPNVVKQSLIRQFSYRKFRDGQRGFFHPGDFTFATPVYLSQIVSYALEIPGVAWIDIRSPKMRFQRWNQASSLEEGRIYIGKLEIAEVQNNPAAPEHGRIEFLMEVDHHEYN